MEQIEYSPLTLHFTLKYPHEHHSENIVGHFFNVKPENIKLISQLTIECVKLNGGTCVFDFEELLIGTSNDINYTENCANHFEVICSVFSRNPDFDKITEEAMKIWDKINKECKNEL